MSTDDLVLTLPDAAIQVAVATDDVIVGALDDIQLAVSGISDLQVFVDSSGFSTRFTGLLDAPKIYTGATGQFVRVNGTETGLEFGSAAANPLLANFDLHGHYLFDSTDTTGNVTRLTFVDAGGGFPSFEVPPGGGLYVSTTGLDAFGDPPAFLTWNGATAAALLNNEIGAIAFQGNNSVGGSGYAQIYAVATNTTQVSQASKLILQTTWAGAALNSLQLGMLDPIDGVGIVHLFDYGATDRGRLILHTTSGGDHGLPLLTCFANSPTPAALDYVGGLEGWGRDSTNVVGAYTGIYFQILDPLHTAPQGQYQFYAASGALGFNLLATLDDLGGLVCNATGGISLFTTHAANGFFSQVNNSGAVGTGYYGYQNSTTPAVNDKVCVVEFAGNNLALNYIPYADIVVYITSPTTSAESGLTQFLNMRRGAQIVSLTLGTQYDASAIYGGVSDAAYFDFDNGIMPMLVAHSTNADSQGPHMVLFHDRTTPAIGDQVGQYLVHGRNSAHALIEYGAWSCELIKPLAGSECSQPQIWAMVHGAEQAVAIFDGSVLPVGSGASYNSRIKLSADTVWYIGAPLGTVTMSIATPCVVTKTAHGLVAGDTVRFSTTGALPTGVQRGLLYFVLAAGLTANTFEFSLTPGGAAVASSGTQSGIHSAVCGNDSWDGQSATYGHAWASLTHAWNWIATNVDFAGWAAIIQFADGWYDFGNGNEKPLGWETTWGGGSPAFDITTKYCALIIPPVAPAFFKIRGHVGDKTKVVFTTTQPIWATVECDAPDTQFTFDYVTLRTDLPGAWGVCIGAYAVGGSVHFYNVDFQGIGGTDCVDVGMASAAYFQNDLSWTPDAGSSWGAFVSSTQGDVGFSGWRDIATENFSQTMTISVPGAGTISLWNGFLFADIGGLINCNNLLSTAQANVQGTVFSVTGTVSGARFMSQRGGTIAFAGIPGNAAGGTSTTQSQGLRALPGNAPGIGKAGGSAIWRQDWQWLNPGPNISVSNDLLGSETSQLYWTVWYAGAEITALTLNDGGQGQATFNFGAGTAGALYLNSTNPGATGPGFKTYHNSASPAANDLIFYTQHFGNNNLGVFKILANQSVTARNVTSGAEQAQWDFGLYNAGISYTALSLGTTLDGAYSHAFTFPATGGQFVLQTSGATSSQGPGLDFFFDKAVPVVGNLPGYIEWDGKDATGVRVDNLGQINCVYTATTHLAVSTRMDFGVLNAGASLIALSLGTTDIFATRHAHVFQMPSDISISGIEVRGVTPTISQVSSSNAGSYIGNQWFIAKNSANSVMVFAEWDCNVTTVTAGSETSQLEAWVVKGGVERAALSIGTTDAIGAYASVHDLGSIDAPDFTIQNSSAGSFGPQLVLYQNSASPAANDVPGGVFFFGKNSAAALKQYASIRGVISNANSAAESAFMDFRIQNAGALLTALSLGTTITLGNYGSQCDFGTNDSSKFLITSTPTSGTNGPKYACYYQKAVPVINDTHGGYEFWGKTSTAASWWSGGMYAAALNVTNGSQASELVFYATVAGSTNLVLSLAPGTDIEGDFNIATFLGGGNANSSIELTNTHAVNGPGIVFYQNATGAVNNFPGYLDFWGKDASGTAIPYGSVNCSISAATAGAASGVLKLQARVAGAFGNLLTLDGATYAKFSQSFGYATGTGGAVTQATSRTTGVTLNKQCGAITLFSAAGSATWNTFTVTNSVVAATDTIILSQQTGANTYNCIVAGVAAGSFKISVSAVVGTATEAPIINFAVIKAVNA